MVQKADSKDWLRELDNYNFIGIYDVMLDIRTEMNISPNIVIPVLQNIIKFTQLFPADSIGTRDKYCELRWKAIEFLKAQGIIDSFTLISGTHRWEGKIAVELEKDKFDKWLKKMKKEYEKRARLEKRPEEASLKQIWSLLHPKICEVSRSRIESRHFADAAEAAMKEVNTTVKSIVKQKTGEEYDGADLMYKALSPARPIIFLDDMSTETGRNIQQGYMQMFAGAMTGIRNPKAHENIDIDERRAIHFLFLASLLMFKIDQRREGNSPVIY
jgi:uncharacterized protein (TIGR02391 family)